MKFKIKMVSHEPGQRHPLLMSSATGDEKFCAYSHCSGGTGGCGYPALFLLDGGGEALKAHGSMVACGPVWQKKKWDGRRVYLPKELSELKSVQEM